MMEKKKSIRRKSGQVVRIPLSNNIFGYGQVLDSGCVFFDYKDDGKNTDLAYVIKQPVLFEIGIDSYIIKEGLWEIIGVLPVNPEFEKICETMFTYNRDTNEYYIWRKGSSPVPGTPDDIKHMEMLTSWGNRSVEQRLLDYFEGRPNYSYEFHHNQHNPNFPKIRKEFYAQYGYTMKEDEPGYQPE